MESPRRPQSVQCHLAYYCQEEFFLYQPRGVIDQAAALTREMPPKDRICRLVPGLYAGGQSCFQRALPVSGLAANKREVLDFSAIEDRLWASVLASWADTLEGLGYDARQIPLRGRI